MFSSVVPVYNSLIWLSKLIVNNVFLDTLLDNLPSVKQFGVSAANLTKNLALEVPPFVSSVALQCDYARDGDFCYEPGGNGRTIDLITPMADVRRMMGAVTTLLLSFCGSGAAIFNIGLYPLFDINLAKAVHNLVNFVLFTGFQIPSVTAQRCKNHGPAVGGSLLMCMPDMNQPINMLVAGLRNLGMLIDNWLDVSSIIAQRSLGLLSEEAAAALDCESVAKSLAPASYSKDLFDDASNRHKVVVGMTDGLYAVTDGR